MSSGLTLRILHGKALVRAGKAPGYKVLHETPVLRIESATPGATAVAAKDGTLTIRLGRVLGKNQPDGKLAAAAPLPQPSTAPALAEWQAQHDGRFVIAHVAADGACRVMSDRYGKVDLFLQTMPGGATLATTLDLLPEAAGAAGFDQSALAHTLTYYGHRPPKRHTIYNGVARLGVGEIAELNNGTLSIVSSGFKPVPAGDYGPADHDRYADLFLDTLSKTGSSDGNVVYLSSGWDSTSILAGLVHLYGPSKVRAVIGRMHYSQRSGNCNRFEIERAQKFADFYGIKLEYAEFNYDRSGPGPIERARQIFKPHMYFSLTGLNHLLLAEKTAESARSGEAVFAGEISDGAHNLGFSQYASVFHPSYEFREYADKMSSYLFGPTFLKELIAGRHEGDAVYKFFRDRAGATHFETAAGDAPARTRQMFVDFFLRNGRRPLWSIKNTAMLTPEGARLYTDDMSQAYLSETSAATPQDLYSWYLHLYNSFHWQGSTVATLQTLAEQKGLEAHLPYWSGGLQDFLSAMPESWGRGLDFNSTKYPLKWMLKNRIKYPYDYQSGPHSYTYDVEHDFNHGEEFMCHSSITPFAQALLAKRAYRDVLSPKVFDVAYIDGIVDDYVAGTRIGGSRLNDLISVYLLSQTGWYA